MTEPLDPKNVDKRTAARYVRVGLLDEKAYEKYVKNLPDVGEKMASVDTTMADDEMEDESDAAK
ncbi:MAG: hypothetical protein ACYC8T_10000 [Myxococcaceae bacterium]